MPAGSTPYFKILFQGATQGHHSPLFNILQELVIVTICNAFFRWLHSEKVDGLTDRLLTLDYVDKDIAHMKEVDKSLGNTIENDQDDDTQQDEKERQDTLYVPLDNERNEDETKSLESIEPMTDIIDDNRRRVNVVVEAGGGEMKADSNDASDKEAKYPYDTIVGEANEAKMKQDGLDDDNEVPKTEEKRDPLQENGNKSPISDCERISST